MRYVKLLWCLLKKGKGEEKPFHFLNLGSYTCLCCSTLTSHVVYLYFFNRITMIMPTISCNPFQCLHSGGKGVNGPATAGFVCLPKGRRREVTWTCYREKSWVFETFSPPFFFLLWKAVYLTVPRIYLYPFHHSPFLTEACCEAQKGVYLNTISLW